MRCITDREQFTVTPERLNTPCQQRPAKLPVDGLKVISHKKGFIAVRTQIPQTVCRIFLMAKSAFKMCKKMHTVPLSNDTSEPVPHPDGNEE
jgi:hypothetical protein